MCRSLDKITSLWFHPSLCPIIPAVLDHESRACASALHKGYDPSVFRLLLKHGADPDLPGRDGRTVREMASRKRDRRYATALR
jgi:hypothetical protein